MSCGSHNHHDWASSLSLRLRWTTLTDSGFDTGERQRHQQGWLVCATNKYFDQERTAPVSVLAIGGNICGKLRRGGDDMDQSVVGVDDLERF